MCNVCVLMIMCIIINIIINVMKYYYNINDMWSNIININSNDNIINVWRK